MKYARRFQNIRPQKRAFFALFIAAICFIGGLTPFSVSAVGGFGGRPAYPRPDNPRTESIFVHELDLGDVQEEGVKLFNNSEETKTLLVYAADSVHSTGGAFACKQRGEPKEGVGAWIALEKTEVTLSPGQNALVPFTITVPQNAGAGEQNGCILIEEKKPTAENAGGGVNLSFRTGMRVAITVPGEIVRALQIETFYATKQEDGGYVVHLAARNTGNVSIDADVRVRVYPMVGKPFADFWAEFPVLRGDMGEWNFDVEKPFWGGWYFAKAHIEYDASAEAGVGVETGSVPERLEGGREWFFVAPSWQALLVYAVILLGLAFGVRQGLRAWQIRSWIEKSWKPYEVQPGDTVTVLAERCGIPWKMLAKGNGLKPPYALEPGMTLKAPMRLTRSSAEADRRA
ncbi:MAG: hypothetical protein RL141_1104 [Candidatus Parcubacteria bacterium]|jgi:hypothetical protein